MAKMKFQRLLKEIRLELSEATLADKEGLYVRAKACLLRIKNVIAKDLSEGEANEKDY